MVVEKDVKTLFYEDGFNDGFLYYKEKVKEEIEKLYINIEDFVKFHTKEWENNLGVKFSESEKLENRIEIVEWKDDYKMFLKFIKYKLKNNLGIEK